MIKVENRYPPIARLTTGYYSFDRAFTNLRGDIGLPLRDILEISGPAGIGKSTWAWTLASMINPIGEIALGDLEGMDLDYALNIMEKAGFQGTLNCIQEPTDEKVFDRLVERLEDEDVGVAILDSLGAVSPISEVEGDTGDANMGRRGRIMAMACRKFLRALRNKSNPSIFIYITHSLPNLGSLGWTASGGVVKQYLAGVRIRLKLQESFEDGSYIIWGKVEKNRFGLGQRTFQLFCLAGYGYHRGLSALVDCVQLGYAKRDKVVKMEDKSYGYLSKLIVAGYDDPEAFNDFINRLKEPAHAPA